MKSFIIFAIVIALLNLVAMLYLVISLNKPEGLVFALISGVALIVFTYEYKKRF